MKKFLCITLATLFSISYGQLTQVQELTLFNMPNTNNSSMNYNNVVWNNKVFYIGYSTYTNPITTINLMSTNGTPGNVSVVKNLISTPAYPYFNFKQWKPAGNYLYFVIELYKTSPTTEVKHQLWRTDGTNAGTILVDEAMATTTQNYSLIDIGSEYSFFNGVYTPGHIGNKFYYSKYETNRYFLWETDGNPANNLKISTTYAGPTFTTGSKKSIDYIVYNNNLYFVSNGSKLIKYETGTFTEIATFGQIGKLGMLFNNKLFFYAVHPTPSVDPGQPIPSSPFPYNKMGIYSTDGTIAGTTEFSTETYANVNATSPDVLSYLFKKTDAYFLVPDYQGTRTKLNSIKANGVVAGVFNSTISKLFDAVTNTNICFFITQSNSNPTSFNTSKINENGNWAATIGFAPNKYLDLYTGFYGNSLFFSRAPSQIASDPTSGDAELWRTNGNNNETGFVIEINPAVDSGIYPRGSNPFFFFTLNNELYFIAEYNYKKYLYKFKADFTFNNSQNDNFWISGKNWNALMVPLSTDDALIPASYNVVVDINATARNLQMFSPINLTSGNLSIYGNANLGAKITLNNNNLNLSGRVSQITNGNATNYIVTNGTGVVNVENLNTTRGTVNLPIGTATNYNPVSIANTGTTDTFSARVAEGNTSTNPNINATWEISEAVSGGSNVNLTLGWNQAQENGTFDRNTAKIGHFVGGNWVQETSGTLSGSNPYTLSASGITTFSPFSVMNFSTLGTVDLSKNKVQIYPNPFNENLNISTQENGVVYFYDGSGKLVSTSLLMKGNNVLNKSSLQSGIYIYQIKGKDGNVVSSGKLIKK